LEDLLTCQQPPLDEAYSALLTLRNDDFFAAREFFSLLGSSDKQTSDAAVVVARMSAGAKEERSAFTNLVSAGLTPEEIIELAKLRTNGPKKLYDSVIDIVYSGKSSDLAGVKAFLSLQGKAVSTGTESSATQKALSHLTEDVSGNPERRATSIALIKSAVNDKSLAEISTRIYLPQGKAGERLRDCLLDKLRSNSDMDKQLVKELGRLLASEHHRALGLRLQGLLISTKASDRETANMVLKLSATNTRDSKQCFTLLKLRDLPAHKHAADSIVKALASSDEDLQRGARELLSIASTVPSLKAARPGSESRLEMFFKLAEDPDNTQLIERSLAAMSHKNLAEAVIASTADKASLMKFLGRYEENPQDIELCLQFSASAEGSVQLLERMTDPEMKKLFPLLMSCLRNEGDEEIIAATIMHLLSRDRLARETGLMLANMLQDPRRISEARIISRLNDTPGRFGTTQLWHLTKICTSPSRFRAAENLIAMLDGGGTKCLMDMLASYDAETKKKGEVLIEKLNDPYEQSSARRELDRLARLKSVP
jgi:hypothetical protein